MKLILAILPLCCTVIAALPERCFQFRFRRHVLFSTEEDNGFEVRVRRANDRAMVGQWYEPGQEYTVELTNKLPFVTFQDFLLWLSSSDLNVFEKQLDSNLSDSSTKCVGSWVHLSGWQRGGRYRPRLAPFGITKSRIGCMGLVAEPSSNIGGYRPTSKVVIRWRAPETVPEDSSGCVVIHAMVRTHSTAWKEVGGLMKTLCPSPMRPMEPVLSETDDSLSKKPVNIFEATHTTTTGPKMPREMLSRDTMLPSDCCACGTATYRLQFQGLWNRSTHPRDWPVNHPNLLHWTNLIGASHSPSFHMYSIGQPASAGVQSICAYGDTTIMRQALTLASSKSEGGAGVPTGTQTASTEVSPLHSLLSTPGMWGEETLNEPRTALIAVNRTHPLISLVTMLGPSPDWCTGISGQSVCKSDCTWVDKLEINLYPWDAGVRQGNTYMPKNADRLDIPDPIRYIDEKWMPGNPFYEHKPVARVTVQRILPEHAWQCTNRVADGVHLFQMGGTVMVSGKPANGSESVGAVQQVSQKKGRKGGKAVGFGGPGASGSLGTNDPLSDPSLAQMATFLCITSDWSAWGPCSVTCGVGSRKRQRTMISNKKPELCQHVQLTMEESCEGRQRTCDFSAPCSLLPWTAWSPCNATCQSPNHLGTRVRKRTLARRNEEGCDHLFPSARELATRTLVQTEECQLPPETCDPATICGEGPKEGFPCGEPTPAFYYSAIEHDCLPFTYLGCKGGRNRFSSAEACKTFCLPVVEALPAWRRERMGLLQFKTSQLSSTGATDESEGPVGQNPACHEEVNTGEECDPPVEWESYWYYCPRTHRCRDFVYLGCKGTANRFTNHTACMAACMPNELRRSQQLARLRHSATKTSNMTGSEQKLQPEDNADFPVGLESMVDIANPKQDCQVTAWGAWGPCSAKCASEQGRRFRLRAILRPSRYGGKTCGPLYERTVCRGADASC
uniref:Spondin-1 n=1 Tax=Schistocephalus solidus TaxID=70667 RepID=A0A0X3PKV3_SCHSO